LSHYRPYRVVDDIPIADEPVPGLRGEFFRREVGDRVATVGLYRYAGSEFFQAWGYAGEPRSRFSILRAADGEWESAQPGCPQVLVVRDGGHVLGVAVRSEGGHWVVELPLPVPDPGSIVEDPPENAPEDPPEDPPDHGPAPVVPVVDPAPVVEPAPVAGLPPLVAAAEGVTRSEVPQRQVAKVYPVGRHKKVRRG
jgi:hypothetical protein